MKWTLAMSAVIASIALLLLSIAYWNHVRLEQETFTTEHYGR